MNEERTQAIYAHAFGKEERRHGVASSVKFFESFESSPWFVEKPTLRSTDISSLTVQTAFAQPTAAFTSVRSDLAQRVPEILRATWGQVGALEAVRVLDMSLSGSTTDVVRAVESWGPGARVQWRSADAIVILAIDSGAVAVVNQSRHIGGQFVTSKSEALTNRAQARALLRTWLLEDASKSDQSMELLKTELDKHRESDRKLFP